MTKWNLIFTQQILNSSIKILAAFQQYSLKTFFKLIKLSTYIQAYIAALRPPVYINGPIYT